MQKEFNKKNRILHLMIISNNKQPEPIKKYRYKKQVSLTLTLKKRERIFDPCSKIVADLMIYLY